MSKRDGGAAFPSDTEMIDWLEKQNNKALYSGLCIFRWSTTGRGWRLHETSVGVGSVRKAIADAMLAAREARDE